VVILFHNESISCKLMQIKQKVIKIKEWFFYLKTLPTLRKTRLITSQNLFY